MPDTGATAIVPLAALFGLLAWCAIDDIRTRTIPHAAIAAIILVYIVFALAGHADWLSGLISAGILLLLGFLLFYFNIMGGGDSKLIAAMGLWVGLSHMVAFLLYTAIAGGFVTLAVLLIHHLTARNSGNITPAAPTVPYGVAIALGGSIAAWQAALTEAI
ncbi:prepilin peptidase [Emcibacter sp. SYSU 3D8]|uniref:A24 family peptidase n=1 Tax=Emcibacter sp. SYSU 3D8 TaxID=3133969 RepID=UPI0031FED107